MRPLRLRVAVALRVRVARARLVQHRLPVHHLAHQAQPVRLARSRVAVALQLVVKVHSVQPVRNQAAVLLH